MKSWTYLEKKLDIICISNRNHLCSVAETKANDLHDNQITEIKGCRTGGVKNVRG